MTRITKLFATLFLAALALGAGAEPTANEAAITFVKNQKMGANLRPMALTFSAKSPMFTMLAKRLGPDEANAAVTRQIDRLLPRYQIAFEKDLAKVYANHFSAEELVSLTADGKASKYMPKFEKKSNDVRRDIEESSHTGVLALSTLAMTNVWSRSGNVTFAVE